MFCFSILCGNKVLSLPFSSSVSKTSSSEEIADEAYEQQYSGARPAKRLKLIDSDGPMRIANPKDNRQWTALHKEAANVNNRTLSSLSVLTPPQEGQECTTAQHSDVNAVGPGGVTPLMLAASRGNYLDGAYEDENSDDSGAQVCYNMFIQLDFAHLAHAARNAQVAASLLQAFLLCCRQPISRHFLIACSSLIITSLRQIVNKFYAYGS